MVTSPLLSNRQFGHEANTFVRLSFSKNSHCGCVNTLMPLKVLISNDLKIEASRENQLLKRNWKYW